MKMLTSSSQTRLFSSSSIKKNKNIWKEIKISAKNLLYKNKNLVKD